MDEELVGEASPSMMTRKKSKTTMTVDYADILAARQTSRSPRIPFPSYHVHRTRSEIDLCHDKERANERELIMFHRLVNGIRERQQKLGLGSEAIGVLASDLMENIPETIRQANPSAFPPLQEESSHRSVGAAVPVTGGSKLPWPPQTTEARQVPAIVPQDDWSISGFEGQGDDGSTSIEQPFGWGQRCRNHHEVIVPKPTLQGTYQYEEATAQDEPEDIFQLDL